MTRSTPSPPPSMLFSPPVILGHPLRLPATVVPALVRAPNLPHDLQQLLTDLLLVRMANVAVGVGAAATVISTKAAPPLLHSPGLLKARRPASTHGQGWSRRGPCPSAFPGPGCSALVPANHNSRRTLPVRHRSLLRVFLSLSLHRRMSGTIRHCLRRWPPPVFHPLDHRRRSGS
jgi:hypothetical protein